MAKPPGKCIYCGGRSGGFSHEHVWADWLRKYIPRTESEYRIVVETVPPSVPAQKVKKQTDDPRARSIRKVCGKCNSGWMSLLQAAARPFLVPLLESQETALDQRAQSALACWIAMLVMISEHDPRTFVAIHQNDRTFLRTNLRVPDHWRIWAGHYPGKVEQYNEIHIPMILVDKRIPDRDDVSAVTNNTKAVSFFLGKLFVSVMASSLPLGQRFINALSWPDQIRVKFPQIWPVVSTNLTWPPMEGLTAAEAAFVSDGLPSWLSHLAGNIT